MHAGYAHKADAPTTRRWRAGELTEDVPLSAYLVSVFSMGCKPPTSASAIRLSESGLPALDLLQMVDERLRKNDGG